MAKKSKVHRFSHAVLPLLLAGIFVALAGSVINLSEENTPTGFVVQESQDLCGKVSCGFNSVCEQSQCVCAPDHLDATCDATPSVDEDARGCSPSRICTIY